MTATTPIIELVARAASWVLPGGRRTLISNVDPTDFLSTVSNQRVSGLVVAAADEGAFHGWSDDVIPRLHELHLGALRPALAAEAASVEVHDLLAAAGIRHAILKGCATCQLDYPDPAMRITGDVDLLIARSDHARTIACLEAAGLHRMMPAFRTAWERRYGKDIALIGESRVEIDVHLALVSGYFGIRMPTTPLFERLVTYPVAGRQLPALDAVDRVIHAAIHTASSASIRLGSAADIVQIAGTRSIDAGEIADRSASLSCDAIVAAGVRRTWETFDVEPCALSEWAVMHRPSDREAAALAAFGSGTGEAHWQSGIVALPWRRRPGYVWPLVVPSREHLQHRGRTLPGHLRHSWRRLRGN